MSIRFKYEGPMRVGFASIGREVGPGEEFDVPEDQALSFAGHGHCTCLEPEKLEPLRAAAAAAEQAQSDARAAAGLIEAHPAAQKAAADRAAAAAGAEPAPPTPVIDQPEPEPAPAPAAPKRATKTDPPATAATAK